MCPSNEETPEIEIVEPLTIANMPQRKPKGGYIPTPNEQRMLDVLTDPESRLLPITRQCELAEVSRQAYYNAMNKPAFVAHYRELLLNVIRLHAGQLINVAVDHARRGSFPHLKLLMEMGGLYVDQSKVEHSGDITISVRFADPHDAAAADEDDE